MSAKRAKEGEASQQAPQGPRVYSLDVSLIGGPMTESFIDRNPEVSRTIFIRGDQSLEELHYAIFKAFNRSEEHLYEFQVGKRINDRKGKRYILSGDDFSLGNPAAGTVDETTIDALGLKVRQSFFYWFDFGDDWYHKIKIAAIDQKPPRGKYPRVVKRVGKSPPQYPEWF